MNVTKAKPKAPTIAAAKASERREIAGGVASDLTMLRVAAAWMAWRPQQSRPIPRPSAHLRKEWLACWPKNEDWPGFAVMCGMSVSLAIANLEALRNLGLIYPDGTVARSLGALMRSAAWTDAEEEDE